MNTDFLTRFDPLAGTVVGYPVVERRLSQLAGVFADTAVYRQTLAQSDPLIYSVASVTLAEGDGQLHYGVGKIMPGRIGQEYFMTRGHLHEWREAAEIYIGLSGSGLMLLEDEKTGESKVLELGVNTAVYVPAFTAHRTINIGDTPLTYIGIYPARAGHDYGALAEQNFRQVVIAQDGKPVLLDRQTFRLDQS
ncbi:MAG: cupin domain-containing protein [Ardenticatenaceae bacterium]|nr:cupin domain-containing protein [Ardenticatenaceae bacterium]